MTIQTIRIDEQGHPGRPIVRLAGPAPGSIWEYSGFNIRPWGDTAPGEGRRDLNSISQAAAKLLAEKVAGRGVRVELIIDPLLPPLNLEMERLVPIVTAIAENASASVEPGPGTVILRTWWHDKHIGIDAIGRGGSVPEPIRQNLMRPGFTTRVAEWDTGFGLHAAIEAAQALAARVEFFEPDNGVGFRLVIPMKAGSPPSPPSAEVGLDCEGGEDEEKKDNSSKKDDMIPLKLWGAVEVLSDVCIEA